MVAGHYGAHFTAEGIGASGIHEAAGRDRDELIGGKHQFCGERGAGLGMRRGYEAIATLGFGIPSSQGAHGPDSLPRFRGCEQCNVATRRTFDLEGAGRPEISDRFIAALFFGWIMNLFDLLALNEKLPLAG